MIQCRLLKLVKLAEIKIKINASISFNFFVVSLCLRVYVREEGCFGVYLSFRDGDW